MFDKRSEAEQATFSPQNLGVLKLLFVVLSVGTAYLILGRLALYVASGAGYASPIWPAAGLALGSVLIRGPVASVGVFLGSYLNNLLVGDPFAFTNHTLSAAIGLGATAQALMGLFLIKRFIGFPTRLEREQDVFRFFALGGALACVINAATGSIALWGFGIISQDDVVRIAAIWWLGDTLGVVVIAPIIVLFWSPHKETTRNRFIAVLITSTIMLSLSVAVYETAKSLEQKRVELVFQNHAQSVTQTLERSLQDSLSGLDRVRDIFHNFGIINRVDFRNITWGILEDYPGLRAISWNEIVREDDVSAFVRRMKDPLAPGFAITERNANGDLVPASVRPDHIVVSYIEPLAQNRLALGFDVGSNVARRKALDTARDTGEAMTTGRITLVQETAKQFGVLVFMPFFGQGPAPQGITDRQNRLLGYITGVYSIGTIVNDVLHNGRHEHLDISLTDSSSEPGSELLYPRETSEEHKLRTHKLDQRSKDFGVTLWTQDLSVPGRKWVLTVRPNSDFFAEHASSASWFIFLAMVLLSAMVSVLTMIVTGRQKLIQELVEVRTAELQRARLEAEKANSAKSEFLSSMSHELRTPLNSILGFGQILELDHNPPLSPSQKQGVAQILKGGRHLLELIEQILDLARIETGRLDLHLSDIKVPLLIQDCVSFIQPQAEHSKISLSTDLSYTGEVRADTMRLKQVMLNLMSNAVKYNREDGHVTIAVTGPKGGMVRFEVSDNGHGIAEELHHKVFEPFERLGQENSVIAGTGVGLTVTKQLVEAMGGSIGFESQINVGSTFWIELPAN
ncbi:CHASE domain-containing protein [Magnetovibrio sp.]|uniref:CHASE domain-containing protein n=1 Tax=Magnetovibrio sp. TaxID=2024836 RepID=UPI002F956C71